MFANERRNSILKEIEQNGAVTTSGLVKKYDVSIETVRRDLAWLEVEGKLVRVHGGAVAKSDMKPFYDLPKRNREYADQKRELSLIASSFIKNGDIIGIDSGSTAIIFAEVIKDNFSDLTIVTHSSDVYEILKNNRNFEIILVGGHYLKGENAFYGELTLNMLRFLHMRKVFIFPTAVSMEYGICDYQKELYQIQKQLIKCSDEIFILADSSKFEKKALLKLSDTEKDFVYITDSDLNKRIKSLYEENGYIIYSGGKKQNGKADR